MRAEWGDTFDGQIPDMELNLCLCGRDPGAVEVRADLVKVMALGLRFGLVPGGCLRDAAAAYTDIMAALVPGEARALEQVLIEVEENLHLIERDGPEVGGSNSGAARLH